MIVSDGLGSLMEAVGREYYEGEASQTVGVFGSSRLSRGGRRRRGLYFPNALDRPFSLDRLRSGKGSEG